MTRSFLQAVASLSVLLLVATGCSPSSDESSSPSTSAAIALPVKYVAVGASESVGVGADRPAEQAWPVLVKNSLPAGSTYVNVAVDGSTTAQALADQLPKALAGDPDIATVWLNVNDLIRQVPPSQYEEQLRQLLTGLRRDGQTEVYVANTPPLSDLPALAQVRTGPYGAFVPGPEQIDAAVENFNQIITRVAAETGSTVVDLNSVGEIQRSGGNFGALISADGFHPSTAGHQAVADAFTAAIERR